MSDCSGVPYDLRVTITSRDVADARAALVRAVRRGAPIERVRILHRDLEQLRLVQAMQAVEAMDGDLPARRSP